MDHPVVDLLVIIESGSGVRRMTDKDVICLVCRSVENNIFVERLGDGESRHRC
jgi:hypothetical protein